MPIKTLLLLAVVSVMLTACAMHSPQSLTPSMAQTKTLVPTVECGQDAPDEALPDYPAAPAEPTTLAELQTFSRAQMQWAVAAARVHQRERAMRAGTAACLRGLRERGLIN